MEKINIAELLKDCPKGMELDCINYDGIVTFEEVTNCDYYPIKISIKYGNESFNHTLTRYGQTCRTPYNKCIIFPKGKTTWEGFQRPFKDGDILVGKSNQPFIFKKLNDSNGCISYCGIDCGRRFLLASDDWTFANSLRFATEEEKQKLFDAIKENGYRWNADKKELEKLVEPKFKVGDRVKHKNSSIYCTLGEYSEGISAYRTNIGLSLTYKDLEQWELAPNKFDISTLKPFDKVLVRCNSLETWHIQFFEKYNRELGAKYPFVCLCNSKYCQCIPYKGNEHLLGTTNDCDEYYKTWK